MSALGWLTSGTILVCFLRIFYQFLYLKMKMLKFFNTLFGIRSQVATLGNVTLLCSFPIEVGKKKGTELACSFEHSLVCLHDASMLLPWTEMGTKWLWVSSWNEEFLLPSESCPSCPMFTHAALWDGVGRFAALPQTHHKPVQVLNLKHQSITNNENSFTEDWMDRFDLVSDQKSGSK